MLKHFLAAALAIALASPALALSTYVTDGTTLYTVSGTGTLTSKGTLGIGTYSMTSTGSGGTIYGCSYDGSCIFTINPSTAACIDVGTGSTGVSFQNSQLVYQGGTLYMVVPPGDLFTINLSTGAATATGVSLPNAGPVCWGTTGRVYLFNTSNSTSHLYDVKLSDGTYSDNGDTFVSVAACANTGVWSGSYYTLQAAVNYLGFGNDSWIYQCNSNNGATFSNPIKISNFTTAAMCKR